MELVMFFLCLLSLINNELDIDLFTHTKVMKVNNLHWFCLLYTITSAALIVLDVDCCVLGCDTMWLGS
jgi:hypothetical protein